MGMLGTLWSSLREALHYTLRGQRPRQSYRDAREKGHSLSVESIVCETLANLTCMDFEMPVSGASERARVLDATSTAFCQGALVSAVAAGMLTGDSLTVPVWTGSGFKDCVVPAGSWRILAKSGDEPTAVAYVVDEVQQGVTNYKLVQVVDLVGYDANGGGRGTACRYRLMVATNDHFSGASLMVNPAWAEAYGTDGEAVPWQVNNCDRLLVARWRNFAIDPARPNSTYGVPACFGASAPIREIHYLLDQMHTEFELSEKAVFASKSAFAADKDGNPVLPRGRDRLYMMTRGHGVGDATMQEWAPTIQNGPYESALEVHKRLVERAVGVDSGIISTPNEPNYMNLDNVRKSTINTQAFVRHARDVTEGYLDRLTWCWDTLLNHYGFPTGAYDVQYKWSDDYINTFADQSQALLSGVGVGATDALDYRLFLLGEAPEVARQRVEEIAAARQVGLIDES